VAQALKEVNQEIKADDELIVAPRPVVAEQVI